MIKRDKAINLAPQKQNTQNMINIDMVADRITTNAHCRLLESIKR